MVWSQKERIAGFYITTVKDGKGGFVKISRLATTLSHQERVDELYLVHYNKKLEPVYKKEIPIAETGQESPSIISIRGHYYMLAYKGEKQATVFITPLDVDQDRVGASRVILDYEVEKRYLEQYPKVYYSPDSGKVLVSMEYIRNKKDNQQFSDAVIDQDGRIIWSKKFEIPVPGEPAYQFPADDKNILRQTVSNAGEVYTIYPASGKDRSFNLVSIDSTGNLKKEPLELPVERYYDGAIQLNSLGQIIYGGLYSNSSGNTSGYFLSIVDPASAKLISGKSSPFTSELIDMIREDKQSSGRGGQTGLASEFLIRSVSNTPNGSVYFTLEFQRMKDMNFQISSEYGDLLVFAYRPEGEFQPIRIPKLQQSKSGNLFSSYYGTTIGNKMCFFYLDCSENVASPDKLEHFSFSMTRKDNLLLVLATIDEHNKMTRKTINSIGDLEFGPRTNYFQKISGNEISMFGSMFKYIGFPDEAIGVMTVH